MSLFTTVIEFNQVLFLSNEEEKNSNVRLFLVLIQHRIELFFHVLY
jgi:hypothetical protein